MVTPVLAMKSNHTLLPLALALAVLLGPCTWNSGTQLEENEQVSFLVLTEMIDLMEGEVITGDSVGRVYCVSVGYWERPSFRVVGPSDGLLRALGATGVSVTKAPSCSLDLETGSLETIDSKFSVLVWVDQPEQLSADTVTVEAGYFIGRHDEGIYSCSLARSGSEWGVQKCELTWIT